MLMVVRIHLMLTHQLTPRLRLGAPLQGLAVAKTATGCPARSAPFLFDNRLHSWKACSIWRATMC